MFLISMCGGVWLWSDWGDSMAWFVFGVLLDACFRKQSLSNFDVLVGFGGSHGEGLDRNENL